MPTLKLCTGFEHGTTAGITLPASPTGNRFCDATGGTPSVVSSAPVRSGTYALELNPAGGTEYVEWTTNTLGASLTSVVVGLAIRFPTALPSNDAVLLYMTTNTAEDRILFFRNSDDKLCVGDHTFTTVTAGPTLAADTWYYVDLVFTISGSSHQVQWQVDGTAQTTHSDTVAAGNITGVALGDRFNTNTMTCRYDDVVISTTSGDYPLGTHKVVLLTPDTGDTTAQIGTANATARFTSNGTVETTHNSADILAAVSEVPPTIGASASGVAQRTSGSGNAVGLPMTTYTLGGGETISGVRVLVVGWSGSATANNIGLRTFNGTTETTLSAAADPNFDNSTTAPGWLCKMVTTADFDTQAELDAMVIRYGYSTDVSPVPGAHAIYAEVAVKESTGGATANLDQATETDSALTPTFTKTATLGQTTETDTAPGASLSKAKTLEQATEADSPQPLTAAKAKALGLATATDTALSLNPTKSVILGLATETDAAFTAAFGATLDVTLDQAVETDTPLGLQASKAKALGLAAEADTLLGAGFTKMAVLGLATETDVALAATAGVAANFSLALATEADSALTLSLTRAANLGLAAETDVALGASIRKTALLDLAAEVDEAVAMLLVGQFIPLSVPVAAVRRNTASAAPRANSAGAAVGGNPASTTTLPNPAEGTL